MRNKKRPMFAVFGLMTLVLIFTACGGKAAAEHTEPVPTATFAPVPTATFAPTPTATFAPTPTITVIQFGTPDSDFAVGVAIDGAGNVYVVGDVQQGALPGQTSLGDADAYLRKYDGHGKEIWTQQFGTESEDHATGVTADGAGHLYVVGLTRGAIDGQAILVGIDYDAYVRKFDNDGNVLWTRQFGTPHRPGAQGEDLASDVSVDGAGNVYVVGFTLGSLPGQADLGADDLYLRKYDSDGNELWVQRSGSQVADMAHGVATDGAGNVYVVGDIPGRPGAGEGDAYLRKHDGEGDELWTRRFGSQSGPSASGVAVDGEGNVYVVGSVLGALPGQT